jgi:phosphoglycolate phosphatase
VSSAASGHEFEAVLLDLDGTLVDSRPGILAAAGAALAEVGLNPEVPELSDLLGRPLGDLVAALAPGLDSDGRASLVAAFRRIYDADGWRASESYPGAVETIEALRHASVRLFLVTNKRRTPTVKIVKARGLCPLLEAVYTPDSRAPGYGSKGEMGQACLHDHSLRPESTLVVGDSHEDREMASECGVSFAAAAWGYGDAASCLAATRARLLYDSTGRREYVLGSMVDLLTIVATGESPEAVHEP